MTQATTSNDPSQWCIGLVGYGEVGRILAEDLRARGVQRVVAHDIKLGGNDRTERSPGRAAGGAVGPEQRSEGWSEYHGQALRAHAAQHAVELVGSHTALAEAADLIISAVTASQTLAAAEACAPAVRPGAWYLDLNSASPGAKQRAAAAIDAAGGAYVEGAVMTAVPPYRIAVPLLLGGARAAALRPLLEALGFKPGDVRDALGVASATKMCRSVIIKGLEAMIIEALTAARAYGVEAEVMASLAETFPGLDWEAQATYFFQRVFEHGRRRAEEMREVARTVEEIGLTPWSASGTAERQGWVADLADSGALGDRADRGFAREADWRLAADKILRSLKR